MAGYSVSAIITKWEEENRIFICKKEGKRQHMRARLLDVILAGIKDITATILNDGFAIRDAFEILRDDGKIPNYITLPMFYRWRRKNFVNASPKPNILAALNVASGQVEPIKQKPATSECRKINLPDAVHAAVTPSPSDNVQSSIVLKTDPAEPWRIVPTGELLPLDKDDPRNPWVDGVGCMQRKVNWLVYDSATGIIYDPVAKLPILKSLKYVPASTLRGVYYDANSDKGVGGRTHSTLTYEHEHYFKQYGEIRKPDAFYIISV